MYAPPWGPLAGSAELGDVLGLRCRKGKKGRKKERNWEQKACPGTSACTEHLLCSHHHLVLGAHIEMEAPASKELSQLAVAGGDPWAPTSKYGMRTGVG